MRAQAIIVAGLFVDAERERATVRSQVAATVGNLSFDVLVERLRAKAGLTSSPQN